MEFVPALRLCQLFKPCIRNSTRYPGMRIIRKLLYYPLLSLILILCACSHNSLVSHSGDPGIKRSGLAFTGVSLHSDTESGSRQEAFLDALSQISLFSGAEIKVELASSLVSVSDMLQETSSEILKKEISVFSRSFFQVCEVEYYTEEWKDGGTTQYLSWCRIPFDHGTQEQFLKTLESGYSDEIKTVEARLEHPDEYSGAYLRDLEEATRFYTDLQTRYQDMFSTPNLFTAFIRTRSDMYRGLISAFLDMLDCICDYPQTNVITTRFLLNNKAVMLNAHLEEVSASPLVETISITRSGTQLIGTLKPLHSGATTIRIYPEFERFSPYISVRYFDIPVDLKLENRFAGKMVGLMIHDGHSYLSTAVAALGKQVSDLEAVAVNLQAALISPNLIQAAKDAGCHFLISGTAEITSNRYNQSQGVHIAFPSLSLSVIDLSTGTVIWQNSYPNNALPDIRGVGKTPEQAIQAALSFESVFSSPAFIEAMNRL